MKDLSYYSYFLCLNLGLLGDVDSVEELSNILPSDCANLADASTAEGKSGVVDTFEYKLVLHYVLVCEGDLGLANHVDDLVLLATQEVLDSD